MFIVIHGLHTSTTPPLEYLENIVYGNPRIDAVLVGSYLIAILEYADDMQHPWTTTFDRLGTFKSVTESEKVALQDFGGWVRHYAPGTIAGLTPQTV